MGGAYEVVVVAYDGVRLLDVTGPVEVFTVADEHGADYRVRLASPGGADVRTSSGVRLRADVALADVAPGMHVLIVPGAPDVAASERNTALLAEVRRLSAGAGSTASVCAGAFVLAAAGLLDGRRAATHWDLAERLAARYPKTDVDAESIFVRDGAIVTSAGVTSGIDLALGLVEEDHGPELARLVAKHLVVFLQRPGGQSQYSVRQLGGGRHGEVLRPVLDAVVLDPAADHSLAAMAGRAMLSVRQFTRLFRDETGLSPANYVELARVEAAQNLLETGDEPLDVVARRAGFGSPETMRRAFLRRLGMPPAAYRGRFRTSGAAYRADALK
ncbi:GlxA family transcriptional regulator [Catellatospora sichuanensis]|uniref:GlxA family transcriptional regulator n=1 Tax=Catellatospora sichuanensis TaxID=1969805 RepID=UPI00118296DF|nr:DJ-1/PfpI family protein [Catellatospora sichuanensis]